MKIRSRGELMELIEKCGIRTNLVNETKSVKVFHTIIRIKKRDLFYRLVWREILQNDEIVIQYEENVEIVYWHTPSKAFMTKSEIHYYNENRPEINISEGISDIERSKFKGDLLLKGNVVNSFSKGAFKRQSSMKSTGSSLYLIKKAAEALSKNKNVLFISTENFPKTIHDNILKGLDFLEENEKSKISEKDLEHLDEHINNTEILEHEEQEDYNIKVVGDKKELVDLNYIFREINEFFNEHKKIDLVIVELGELYFDYQEEGYKEFYNLLDSYRRNYGTEIIVSNKVNFQDEF